MADYQDDNIITLNWYEHIRTRPGMYIGKKGDGSSHDDGIYVLLKEVMDNAIDEFMNGYGKVIDITIKENRVTVRDYGRGIPLNKVVDCYSKMNTGRNFKGDFASIGMNGVGVKAVNALSTHLLVQSVRDGQMKRAEFSAGLLTKEYPIEATDEKNGTMASFLPDNTIFENYEWYTEYIENLLWNYVYLNRGLTINFNGKRFYSKNGLLDLLNKKVGDNALYEPIYLKDDNFEFAMVHTNRKYGEEYYTFVNSQYTEHGGTHQQAMREAIVKTFRDFFKKNFEPADVRNSVVANMSIKVKDPIFDSQTKTKLGSEHMEPGGQTIRNYVNDMIGRLLDNYLHKHPDVADVILKKIQEAEKERIAITKLKKQTKEIQKKVSLHNKKLRDCKYHFNTNDQRGLQRPTRVGDDDFHHRGRLGIRFHHAVARREHAGGLQFEGQAGKHHQVEERHLLQRGAESAAGRAQHRGRRRWAALQQHHHRHRCRCRWHAHPAAADGLLPEILPGCGPHRTRLCLANAALPRAQQAEDRLLLLRGGEVTSYQVIRQEARNHAIQRSG